MAHPVSYSPLPSLSTTPPSPSPPSRPHPVVHTSSRVHAIIASTFDLATDAVRPTTALGDREDNGQRRGLGLDDLDRAQLALALEEAFGDEGVRSLESEKDGWVTVADVSRSVEAQVGRWSYERWLHQTSANGRAEIEGRP